MQRPPLPEEEFEEVVRRELLADKLQAAVTGWVTVRRQEADRNTAAATRR